MSTPLCATPLGFAQATDREDINELDACMERFVAGEPRAFERLFQQLAPRLVRSLYLLTGDVDLAEDITQTTFLKVLRARDTYQRGMSVQGWIWVIAKHTLFDERRKRSRTREVLLPDLDLAPVVAGPGVSAAPGELERALQRLPLAQREAVLLLNLYELSGAEAAAAAGTSVGAIQMRAQRGCETLRRLLSPGGSR